MTKPAATEPVALITGAADRIGAAIARRLAREGFGVIVHYRSSSSEAEALVAEIRAAGGRADLARADLADRAQRRTLLARAAQPFGPLTLLVNNASIFEPDAIGDVDEALWDAHFAVHAEAPVFLARDFAAQLPEGARGNIINLVDERVLHLSPAYFSYTLSKATLWAATRTMAQSLAPRVRVNAIGPGPTLQNSHQSKVEFDRSQARLPLAVGPSPEDIAEGVMFILASPVLTGQMLALDGGEHLEWLDRNGPTPK